MWHGESLRRWEDKIVIVLQEVIMFAPRKPPKHTQSSCSGGISLEGNACFFPCFFTKAGIIPLKQSKTIFSGEPFVHAQW
jgi:hypothetical protein